MKTNYPTWQAYTIGAVAGVLIGVALSTHDTWLLLIAVTISVTNICLLMLSGKRGR